MTVPEYDALDKILDQAYELAAENLEHPEFLEFEELLKRARKDLADMREFGGWALKLAEKIIALRDGSEVTLK